MSIKTMQNLTVPKQINTIFAYPEYSSWESLMRRNRLAKRKLPSLLEFRKELLIIATNYTHEITELVCPEAMSENIIVTGHQATWHHCGIFAKNLITSKFAQQVKGCCIHLVLDHDICDTAMILPKADEDGNWFFQKIEIEDGQTSIPLEFRPPPKMEKIKTLIEAVTKSDRERFCSNIWPEYIKVNSGQMPDFKNVADFITCFQSMLNSALGINMIYLSVTKLSESNCFVDFVASIILRAYEFARSYNDAISQLIKKRAINNSETIWKLKIAPSKKTVELPFWLVSPKGKRTSLYVKSDKNSKIIIGTISDTVCSLCVQDNGEKNKQLKDTLNRYGYLLRPKAVTLTLFVRLFLADWFVHGIGGGLYESITNYIIEDYYGIKELGFGIATATLTLPLSNSTTITTEGITRLKQQLRDIKYNPERFIKSPILRNKTVKFLIEKKKNLIDFAGNRNKSATTRKSAWTSICEVNKNLLKYIEQSPQDIKRKIELSKKHKLSRQVLNHREFFFGLFPEKLLRNMLQKND